jgi:hypothetical protein
MISVFTERRKNVISVNVKAVIRRHEHNIYIRVKKQKGRVKIICSLLRCPVSLAMTDNFGRGAVVKIS